MKSHFAFSTIFFFVTLFSFHLAAAQVVIGVSPSDIHFTNVLRGGYAEHYLTISTDSVDPLMVKLEAIGPIASWINLSSSNLTISKSKLGRTLFSVEPPADTPNGNYSVVVRVSRQVSSSDVKDGHATGVLLAVMDVYVTIEVSDVQVVSCTAQQFDIQSVEKGDEAQFTSLVANTGNIRLRPQLVLQVWDQDKTSIVKSLRLTGENVLPTREQQLTFTIPTTDLPTGQYWLDASFTDCYSSDTLTFDVLEPGSLKVNGVLLSIVSRINPLVDETVPIVVTFRNTGEKEVPAQFQGTITLAGNIVQVLESEKTLAPIGDLTNFTLFFTPKTKGDYVITGRVFYGTKRTFESSTVVHVQSKNGPLLSSYLLPLMYISIFLVISFLFYRIQKEKRRHFYHG
jgi:hypothetical protein